MPHLVLELLTPVPRSGGAFIIERMFIMGEKKRKLMDNVCKIPPRLGVRDPEIVERLRDEEERFNKPRKSIANEHWLVEKLRYYDGIYPEDYLKMTDEKITNDCVKFKENIYSLNDNYDVMRLYNHITGKDEKLITWQEYAKQIKERREKK